MRRNKLIELSEDDVITGSIVEDGEVTALLKRSETGQFYYKAKKDSILPVFLEIFEQLQNNPK